jgi:hypothetical protein
MLLCLSKEILGVHLLEETKAVSHPLVEIRVVGETQTPDLQ